MPSKNKTFNLLLTEHEREQLNELAKLEQISAGAVLRRALANLVRMKIDRRPCCADGTACFVEHMHPTRMAQIQPAQVGHPYPQPTGDRTDGTARQAAI